MKKVYSLFVLAFMISMHVSAQCTPDVKIGADYMYPKTLGNAMVGYYYEQVITLRIPSDSNIVINGNTVHAVADSAKILLVLGVPNGYSFGCTPVNCTWPGGHLGCALIQGLTAINDSAVVGEYRIQIAIQTWFRVGPIPYNRVDTTSYLFKIVSYNGQFELSEFKPLSVYPNPSTGSFNIDMRDIQSEQNSLQVYSSDGKMIMEKQFGRPAAFLSKETIELMPEQKGIYFIRLLSGEQVYQQKVLIR
jgi:hypothetical protein